MPLKKIGILDFGYRHGTEHSSERVYSVIKESVLLEKLGFSRIWYAEHFTDNPYFVWSSPDMLIPIIAAHTNTIKVGIAGTSIRFNNPVKIAKDYSFLSETFGTRIDLGFSKGGHESHLNTILDLTTKPIELNALYETIKERTKLTIDLIYSQIVPLKPSFWNLTKSSRGYAESLDLGTNCSRSLIHFNSDPSPDTVNYNHYQEDFLNKYGRYPENNICVAGTIQKSTVLIDLIKENYSNSIDVEKIICGSPDYVRNKLNELAEVFNVDEIIFMELSFAEIDRKASFKHLSQFI